LAVKLIRDKGYGGRRAHRICATFVRIARERGIKPYETTGELLDEAARIADEDAPGLSTEEVREQLDPVEFIERHNNLGDPAPEESRRMIRLRRETLAEANKRHTQRQARIDEAAKKLAAEVAAIVGDVAP
jgi:argininosuccinate lyase